MHPPFYPRAFDTTAWNAITGLDARLLDELAFLSKLKATRSPSGATYATPGRKYLARKLGCSVVTVSRHVSKLYKLGILHRFQRRPVAGQWQTNLYRIIHWQGWRIARLRSMITAVSHRVSKLKHIAPSEGTSRQPSGPDRTLEQLLELWRRRGEPQPT